MIDDGKQYTGSAPGSHLHGAMPSRTPEAGGKITATPGRRVRRRKTREVDAVRCQTPDVLYKVDDTQ
jgi:hypothetical protein